MPKCIEGKPRETPGVKILVGVLYVITLATSAFLLFTVQPLFTRMVLPRLGGSPAVWNTCVMWFQTVLLAGYLYAHILSRLSSAKKQFYVHVVILSAGFFALPIQASATWAPPTGSTPILWLLSMLTISIGLPFFGVSTTAPLLQRWFSWSEHVQGRDPYFLYSASNVGGLLALVSYPTVVEPFLGLRAQAGFWSWSYGLLVVMIGLCGVAMLRGRSSERQHAVAAPVNGVGWKERLRWTALAFVPSSLLLGLTLHITTDVAAVTFLWVLPLSLYTLSFALVFARRTFLKHKWMIGLQPALLVILAVAWNSTGDVLVQLGLHLATFFVTAMVCHGELVKHRPDPQQSTEFYLWISAGGLLGSIFTVLLAPILFSSVLEYPLMLAAACLFCPALRALSARQLRWDLALAGLFTVVYVCISFSVWPSNYIPPLILTGLLGCMLYSFQRRKPFFAVGAALLLLAPPNRMNAGGLVLAQQRTFYGVYRVKANDQRQIHLLMHGSTVHGVQLKDEPFRRLAYVYFHSEGPLGQLFRALDRKAVSVRHIGVAGLGVGSIASYKKPDQKLTYFEIDPTVERLARDTNLFTYLEDFRDNLEVVTGDARLSLAQQPDAAFDLLILDAFTSDAVPIHLMTREAVDLYLHKLRPRGLLVFNISNRYLRLAPVLAALAHDAGLSARIQDFAPTPSQLRNAAYASTWVVMAREAEDLALLAQDPRWQSLGSAPKSMLWTDDYANLFRSLKSTAWLREKLRALKAALISG